MSRQVDISEGYESLSQDDLVYLDQRNQLPAGQRHLLESVGGSPDPEPAEDAAPPSAPADDTSADEGESDEDDYKTWSKEELREELYERDVSFTKKMTVAELIDLLEQDDAEQADEGD